MDQIKAIAKKLLALHISRGDTIYEVGYRYPAYRQALHDGDIVTTAGVSAA